jgi:hypothetical protein
VRRVAVLLVLGLASLATACGGDGEREDVERYIDAANGVQQRFAPRFNEANQAYAAFAKGDLDDVRADIDLTAAEQSLREARERVAALHPPAVAMPMHRRLLRVYDANADFANESTRLGRYLPAARSVLRPLPGIGRRLRSRLRDAKTPSAQATAFDKYARGVYGTYSALRRLDPPPALLPTHRAQLVRLFESDRLADALADAARKRDSKRVARLLLRFRRLADRSTPETVTRSALDGYRERYREVLATVGQLRREQQRLQARFS